MSMRHPLIPLFTCSDDHQLSFSLSAAAAAATFTCSNFMSSPPYSKSRAQKQVHHPNFTLIPSSYYRFSSGSIQEEEVEEEEASFDEAVALFNSREYYQCHDLLEALWNKSQEPTRTILLHAVLQCAVGFHHLFNNNHKGAMMELGEGLCKLRKINFESGPFHEFEKEISAVLDFIYQTQLEHAACTEDYCVALDQSERSYQLLGGYAAGQRLYHLELDSEPSELDQMIVYIVYHQPNTSDGYSQKLRVKLPILRASEENLAQLF